MKSFIRLLRIKQWIKNVLVLLPLLFSGNVFKTNKSLESFIGMLAFCFISSAVYIINDIKDKERDINHPLKKERPIAKGQISVGQALLIICILCIGSLAMMLVIKKAAHIIWIIIYLSINILYSFGLKKKPIIDIAILSSGFLIRVLFGSAIIGVKTSGWLYLTIISAAFYMALGKRRNELKNYSDKNTRDVLERYTYEFLDKNMYMCMGLVNTFYSLWAMNTNETMLWTVPLVIIITMKYSLNVEKGSEGDPTDVILGDKLLMGLAVIYIFIVIYSIYFV